MRARVVAFVVAGAVALAAVVGVVLLLTRPADDVAAPPPASPSATRSAPPTPTPSPTPSFLTAFVPMAAPERIEIPAVSLDLAVLPVDPIGGRIDPPTVEEAYWIQDYGTPGSDADNTVYLVGHSSLSLAAAFNPLLDVEHQDSVLQPGDEIRVTTANGVLRYEVTAWTRYDKNRLPGADEVWAITPGTLHLITCFQEDGQAFADDNLVVTAQFAGGLVPADDGR